MESWLSVGQVIEIDGIGFLMEFSAIMAQRANQTEWLT